MGEESAQDCHRLNGSKNWRMKCRVRTRSTSKLLTVPVDPSPHLLAFGLTIVQRLCMLKYLRCCEPCSQRLITISSIRKTAQLLDVETEATDTDRPQGWITSLPRFALSQFWDLEDMDLRLGNHGLDSLVPMDIEIRDWLYYGISEMASLGRKIVELHYLQCSDPALCYWEHALYYYHFPFYACVTCVTNKRTTVTGHSFRHYGGCLQTTMSGPQNNLDFVLRRTNTNVSSSSTVTSSKGPKVRVIFSC